MSRYNDLNGDRILNPEGNRLIAGLLAEPVRELMRRRQAAR